MLIGREVNIDTSFRDIPQHTCPQLKMVTFDLSAKKSMGVTFLAVIHSVTHLLPVKLPFAFNRNPEFLTHVIYVFPRFVQRPLFTVLAVHPRSTRVVQYQKDQPTPKNGDS